LLCRVLGDGQMLPEGRDEHAQDAGDLGVVGGVVVGPWQPLGLFAVEQVTQARRARGIGIWVVGRPVDDFSRVLVEDLGRVVSVPADEIPVAGLSLSDLRKVGEIELVAGRVDAPAYPELMVQADIPILACPDGDRAVDAFGGHAATAGRAGPIGVSDGGPSEDPQGTLVGELAADLRQSVCQADRGNSAHDREIIDGDFGLTPNPARRPAG